MITYKHDVFLGDAIRGVLNQNVNFEIELVIADDCSPDNTAEIVDSFNSHPKFTAIKYFRHSKNVGMNANFLFAVNECRGEYIALCEGDDFWVEEKKLQTQIEYMRSNVECMLTFTSAFQFDNVFSLNFDNYPIRNNYVDERKFNLKDVLILGGGFFPTASVVFRSELFAHIPFWFDKHTTGDFPLAILAASKGDIVYLDFVSCAYRIHGGSITHKFLSYKKGKYILHIYRKYIREIIFSFRLLKSSVINLNYFFMLFKKYTKVFLFTLVHRVVN